MSYYPTIEEDLARAKAILAKAAPAAWEEANFTPAVIEALRKARANSGHIYGTDIYAAYKLLESFVAEIERLHANQRAAFMAGIDAADTVHATADWTRARDAAFDRYLKEHPHG